MRRPPSSWPLIAAVWIAAALLTIPLQHRLDRSIGGIGGVDGTESAEATRQLRTDFDSPFTSPALLVVSHLAHAADSDSGRADLRAILAPLLASHAVVAALSPAFSLDTLLVGANHTTAIAIVGLTPSVRDPIDSVRAITAAIRAPSPGLTLRWTGEPALVGDLRSMGVREARRAELRAFPITAVVAIAAFGSVTNVLLALGAAAVVIAVALGATGALAGVVPATSFTRTLVSLVGLAMTVDYVLFLTRRARDATARGHLRGTVFVAGTVVAIGFSALAIAPTGELRAAALAGAIACFVAAAAAATLTPLRAPPSPAEQAAGDGPWNRWARFVVRRPFLVLIAAGVPVVVLANAARSARLVTPLDQLLPAGMESADAYRELQLADRAGTAATLHVLIRFPEGVSALDTAGWRAVQDATRALRSLPGAVDARSLTTVGTGDRIVTQTVLPPVVTNTYVSRDRHTGLVDVIPDVAHGDATALELVRRVRALDAPGVTGIAGTRLLVAGLPAYALDYQTTLTRALPLIIAAASVATFFALMIAFRAPVIAVKAVALNLLVAAAAIGATVLVFQDGFGAALIGQHALGSIFPTLPAMAFGAAFGTSTDYELFLLAAVREWRRGGLSDTEAIVAGVTRTGGLITRAAAVMACLFLAFSTSRLLPLAMVGFALAVAVMLDATLVRLALAPALLRIAGRWNWWPRT